MQNEHHEKPGQHSALIHWLNWLEQLHPSEIDLGLERISNVAEKAELLKPNAIVISVAGTNGKGSTCEYLAEMLKANHLTYAKYSSPHFLNFNERISVNGIDASDEQIVEALAAIDLVRGETSLTYFEFTTLAALYIFQQANVDVWLMEVGLGGRLDAVNILDADVSVITSIGLDHEQWLGSDLVQIGREKAGIMRSGRPTVIGEVINNQGLLETADRLGCRVFLKGRDFGSVEAKNSWTGFATDLNNRRVTWEHLPYPHLPFANAATALQVIKLLPFDILNTNQMELSKPLQEARLMGRFQELNYQAKALVLDVAHNPQAAQHLVSQFHNRGLDVHTIVVGMLSDKDCKTTIQELLQLMPKQMFLVDMVGSRGQTSEQLADYISGFETVTCFETVEQAMVNLPEQQNSEVHVVCGSFYTVTDAINVINAE